MTILRVNQAGGSPSPITGDDTPLFAVNGPGRTGMPSRSTPPSLDRPPGVEPGFLLDSPFGRSGACASPLADGSGIGGVRGLDRTRPLHRPRGGAWDPVARRRRAPISDNYKLLRYDEDYRP